MLPCVTLLIFSLQNINHQPESTGGKTKATKMKIKYSDGTMQNAADFADALEGVRANYPNAVAYQGGSNVAADDDVVHGGGRILIWANEEISQNDDGSNAVAVIEEP
jgi:hypothetical protein